MCILYNSRGRNCHILWRTPPNPIFCPRSRWSWQSIQSDWRINPSYACMHSRGVDTAESVVLYHVQPSWRGLTLGAALTTQITASQKSSAAVLTTHRHCNTSTAADVSSCQEGITRHYHSSARNLHGRRLLRTKKPGLYAMLHRLSMPSSYHTSSTTGVLKKKLQTGAD